MESITTTEAKQKELPKDTTSQRPESDLRIRIASALVASQAEVTHADNGDGTFTHTFNFRTDGDDGFPV